MHKSRAARVKTKMIRGGKYAGLLTAEDEWWVAAYQTTNILEAEAKAARAFQHHHTVANNILDASHSFPNVRSDSAYRSAVLQRNYERDNLLALWDLMDSRQIPHQFHKLSTHPMYYKIERLYEALGKLDEKIQQETDPVKGDRLENLYKQLSQTADSARSQLLRENPTYISGLNMGFSL